ncbi:unnamed protein product, partial [Ectocarpus sp. 4 AP-2014]
EGGALTLVGDDFRIDGQPIAGLGAPGATLAYDPPTHGVLTGVLLDGTPFAFGSQDSDSFALGSLTLEAANVAAPNPGSIDAAVEPVPLGVRDGQVLNVPEGATVAYAFMAGRGSRVEVTGGRVESYLEAVGAEVSVSSGEVGDYWDALDGSVIDVTGGELGFGGLVDNGSRVNLIGGDIRSVAATRAGLVSVTGGTVG